MKYLLDTNVCITFLGQRNPILNKRFSSVPAQDKIVCSIVRAELYHGVYKSQRPHVNLLRIDSFLAHLPTLPFDDQAARIYGVARADLESMGNLAEFTRTHDGTQITRQTLHQRPMGKAQRRGNDRRY
jgi:tRNA(fMet)-specific endonuclease VapC